MGREDSGDSMKTGAAQASRFRGARASSPAVFGVSDGRQAEFHAKTRSRKESLPSCRLGVLAWNGLLSVSSPKSAVQNRRKRRKRRENSSSLPSFASVQLCYCGAADGAFFIREIRE